MIISILVSLVAEEAFFEKLNLVNSWILSHFDWLFSYTSFAMVLLCIAIFFSPLGAVRIGGESAIPILSKWRWFSIVLCTTIAVGILFWGVSEPLYHISAPPENMLGTAEFAMSSIFMHWSLTPYAIYSIPALLFALGYYNYNKSYSLGAMLFPLKRLSSSGWIINAVDAICLFALAAGMSGVLAVGMLSLAGGVLNSTDQLSKPILLAVIGIAIVLTFTISAASGLLKGIRVLSSINVTIFITLCVIVFFLGPTSFIIENAAQGLVTYVVNFIPHSLSLGSFGDKNWMHSWTTFYWANWMAWAPITALFLGRISYGYTVRQFMLFNWLIPAGFGIIWMSIFSGTSLFFELYEKLGLVEVLNVSGPDVIIYKIFDQLPFANVLSVLFLLTVFISYVTAADSNTEAMSAISTVGISPESSEPPKFIKYLWGILIGFVAWIMVSFAGVNAVKILSNLGGLPSLFLMVLLCIVVMKLLLTKHQN